MQVPATKGDQRNGRLFTTDKGINYKLESNNKKFATLTPEDIEAEREEWANAAKFVVNREKNSLEKPKIQIKAPGTCPEALKRRQTKHKFRTQDIKIQETKAASDNVIEALTSEAVLSMISEMEEKFQSNIGFIDQISAENTALEERVKELESALVESIAGGRK
jgi:hypothetical protein